MKNYILVFIPLIAWIFACSEDSVHPQIDHTYDLPTSDSLAFIDTCIVPRKINDNDVYGCTIMKINGATFDFIPFFGLIDSSSLGGLISTSLFEGDIVREELGIQFFPLINGIYNEFTSLPWKSYPIGTRTIVDYYIKVGDTINGTYVLDTSKLNFIKIIFFDWSTQVVKARFKFHLYLFDPADKLIFPELADSILIDDGIIYGTFLK